MCRRRNVRGVERGRVRGDRAERPWWPSMCQVVRPGVTFVAGAVCTAVSPPGRRARREGCVRSTRSPEVGPRSPRGAANPRQTRPRTGVIWGSRGPEVWIDPHAVGPRVHRAQTSPSAPTCSTAGRGRTPRGPARCAAEVRATPLWRTLPRRARLQRAGRRVAGGRRGDPQPSVPDARWSVARTEDRAGEAPRPRSPRAGQSAHASRS